MKYLKEPKAYLKSFQQLIRLPLMFTSGGFTLSSSLRPWRSLARCATFALSPWRERVRVAGVRGYIKNFRSGEGVRGYQLGFTLIEILIVVLIIGILGAIALPQYQRALLKSRYAALMPIAKSMANSNEAYFLEHGNYAGNAQDLPVEGRNSYPDGTALEFGTLTDYAYVLAKNQDKIPNNTYVVYQRHSLQYPGEIHCEALADNSLAEGVCKSFGATRHIGPTITPTHNTWLLEGSRGAGIEPEAFEDDVDENGQKVFNCDKATQLSYSCEMIENEDGSTTKKVCNTTDLTQDGKVVCRATTVNPDGSYFAVTCQTNDQGNCKSGSYSEYFDSNGYRISVRQCTYGAQFDGSCSGYYNGGNYDYTYDKDGHLISERQCTARPTDGSCGTTWGTYSYDYLYDEAGNRIAKIWCNRASDGTCSPTRTDYYAYDEKGNEISDPRSGTYAQCTQYSQGVCVATGVSKKHPYHYVYNDADLPIVKTDGHGTSYVYQYDKNGNRIAEYTCEGQYVHNDGTCDQYRGAYFYSYDQNKNITSKRFCKTVANDGTCSEYGGTGYIKYYMTYEGNTLTHISSCNVVNGDGTCGEYGGGNSYDLFYDEAGNLTHTKNCYSSNVNPTTGACNTYNFEYIYAGNEEREQGKIPSSTTNLKTEF